MSEPLNDHPYGHAQHPGHGADPGGHAPSGAPGTPEPHDIAGGPQDGSEGRAVPLPPNVHPANAQPCGGTYAHAAHRWFGYWCAGADQHGLRPIERPAIADQPFLSRLCRDGECGRCHASDCIHPCHRGDALAEALTDEPPLIDPDCRDGKCGSCVGGECEHTCHHPEAKPAGEASTVRLPADVDPQLIRWCRATVEHGPHWWPAAPVAKWCGGVDANGLVRYVDVSSRLVHGMDDAVRDAVGPDMTAEGAAAFGLDQPAGEVPPSEVLADMRAQRDEPPVADPEAVRTTALVRRRMPECPWVGPHSRHLFRARHEDGEVYRVACPGVPAATPPAGADEVRDTIEAMWERIRSVGDVELMAAYENLLAVVVPQIADLAERLDAANRGWDSAHHRAERRAQYVRDARARADYYERDWTAMADERDKQRQRADRRWLAWQSARRRAATLVRVARERDNAYAEVDRLNFVLGTWSDIEMSYLATVAERDATIQRVWDGVRASGNLDVIQLVGELIEGTEVTHAE